MRALFTVICVYIYIYAVIYIYIQLYICRVYISFIQIKPIPFQLHNWKQFEGEVVIFFIVLVEDFCLGNLCTFKQTNIQAPCCHH